MTVPANPAQVEKVLDDLIHRLSQRVSTAEVRAALIEAKRLKTVTTRWAAIPPPPDARREMLARVMDLIAQAGVAASSGEGAPRSAPPPPPRDRPRAPPSPVALDALERSAKSAPARRPSVPDVTPLVARGLTPTPRTSAPPSQPRARAPSGRMPGIDLLEEPTPTPRSRSGGSVPPKPPSSRRPPDSRAPPPPLRGRKTSAIGLPPMVAPSDAAAAVFGSPNRGRTKTGLAEADEPPPVSAKQAPASPKPSPAPPAEASARRRSSAPTAPPPVGNWSRRETKMFGSQGVNEALEAIADAKAPRPPSLTSLTDSAPPPTSSKRPGPQKTLAFQPPARTTRPPSPAPINAVGNYREGGLDGLSSSVSQSNIAAPRAATTMGLEPPVALGLGAAKSPSNPTHQMVTPAPPPPRPSQPPTSDKPLRTVVSPGITIVRPDAAAWQAHPVVPGVTVKLLYRDPRVGVYTALMRLAPGSTLPRRRHASAEELLLVAGIAKVGQHELRAGEYCRAESDTVHDPITTSTGCTFFVCGSENDDILEGE